MGMSSAGMKAKAWMGRPKGVIPGGPGPPGVPLYMRVRPPGPVQPCDHAGQMALRRTPGVRIHGFGHWRWGYSKYQRSSDWTWVRTPHGWVYRALQGVRDASL